MDDMLVSDEGSKWTELSSWAVPRVDESWSLQAIWHGLADGSFRVASSWVAEDRCFVALKRGSGSVALRRYSEVAKRVFSGEQAKVVAVDLSLAPSTVCTYCKLFLEASSERPRTSGLVAFVAKAACAARGAVVAAAQHHGLDREANVVLSIEMRLELLDRASLSRAERDIALMMLEGQTRAEIGQRRGTSPRTLANQIGAIYRKLRVSGRRELVAILVSDPIRERYQLMGGLPAPRRASSPLRR